MILPLIVAASLFEIPPPKESMEVNSDYEPDEAEPTITPDLDQTHLSPDTDCTSKLLCTEDATVPTEEDHTSILLDEDLLCSPPTSQTTMGGGADDVQVC